MMRATVIAEKAWCARPGCTYPNPFAQLQVDSDGGLWARFTSDRWRRDGEIRVGGMLKYRAVNRTGRVIGADRGRGWMRGVRAECPCVVECPGCKTVQAIGLPS